MEHELRFGILPGVASVRRGSGRAWSGGHRPPRLYGPDAASRQPRWVGQLGSATALVVALVRAVRRPRGAFGAELSGELVRVLAVCVAPLGISAAILGFTVLGTVIGNFGQALAMPDRVGGLFGLFGTREIGPLTAALVVTGAAGSSMCAELAARRARGELDALEVLGVEVVGGLVAPRVLAFVLATPILCGFATGVCALVAGPLTALRLGVPMGTYAYSLLNSAPGVLDLWGEMLKGALFGLAIAIVCAHAGLTARRGPAGIGRAVNRSVVAALLAVFAINYVVGQLLLGLNPEVHVVK